MKPAPSFRCSLLVIFLLFFLSPFRQVSVSARRHLPAGAGAGAGAGELQNQPGSEAPSTPADGPERPSSIVRTSCAGARYPSLCIRTLSSSPLPANSTPADLALAAVSASSASSRNAAAFLSRLLINATFPAPAALRDCREQLSDSSDQLEKTARELRRLRPETFRWQMDNAQTWASAAMTNQDTCVQGLQGGGPRGASAEPPLGGSGRAASTVAADTREAVVKKVCGVSQLTSNALYLINRLASTTGGGRIKNP